MSRLKKISITIILILLLTIIIISSICIRFIKSDNSYYISEKNINIPIFVYHNIVKEITAEEYMQTTDENFKKQILGLRDKCGYNIIRYSDLIAYSEGEEKLKEKSVILTFDDGIEGLYNVLFPIIKEYNIPISINIIDNNVGEPGTLNWDEIKEMSNSGLVDFYTHSRYHERPDVVDAQKYKDEIIYAHNHLEEKLGKQITKIFTYPYGISNEDEIEILKNEGFFVQNLTDNKVNTSKNLDLSRLHREYPLNDSVNRILLKTIYRSIRYRD